MEIRGSGHLEFDRALSSRGRKSLRIDLEHVEHVNVYGLLCMSVAVMTAATAGHPIQFTPPVSSSACNFMSRLGFDDLVREAASVDCRFPVAAQQAERDVLVTLRKFETSGDLLPLQDFLWDRLDGVVGPGSRAALGEALWELGANVTEHSHSPGVMAAVVQGGGRRDSYVHFAIGDAGIGIRRSFWEGGRYHPPSDHEAIRLATKYLVSSKPESGRGQGLTETVEQVVGLDGRVTIRTGEAKRVISSRRDGPSLEQVSTNASVPSLAGTVVCVVLPCR